MQKYYCEAQKKQLEKPTEPKYVFCTTAKCFVLAENEDEALENAAAEFREMYHGTGAVLGQIRITKSAELPVDWSYGEGEAAMVGNEAAMEALIRHNVIR